MCSAQGAENGVGQAAPGASQLARAPWHQNCRSGRILACHLHRRVVQFYLGHFPLQHCQPPRGRQADEWWHASRRRLHEHLFCDLRCRRKHICHVLQLGGLRFKREVLATRQGLSAKSSVCCLLCHLGASNHRCCRASLGADGLQCVSSALEERSRFRRCGGMRGGRHIDCGSLGEDGAAECELQRRLRRQRLRGRRRIGLGRLNAHRRAARQQVARHVVLALRPPTVGEHLDSCSPVADFEWCVQRTPSSSRASRRARASASHSAAALHSASSISAEATDTHIAASGRWALRGCGFLAPSAFWVRDLRGGGDCRAKASFAALSRRCCAVGYSEGSSASSALASSTSSSERSRRACLRAASSSSAPLWTTEAPTCLNKESGRRACRVSPASASASDAYSR
eukprot:scaffold40390_cov26-Tisochrysis_lutea.AAC.7